jgi:hypothetical protein
VTCGHKNTSRTLMLDGFLMFHCRDCGAGYDEFAGGWSAPLPNFEGFHSRSLVWLHKFERITKGTEGGEG